MDVLFGVPHADGPERNAIRIDCYLSARLARMVSMVSNFPGEVSRESISVNESALMFLNVTRDVTSLPSGPFSGSSKLSSVPFHCTTTDSAASFGSQRRAPNTRYIQLGPYCGVKAAICIGEFSVSTALRVQPGGAPLMEVENDNGRLIVCVRRRSPTKCRSNVGKVSLAAPGERPL
jgi:hypothetical protein